jgi:hypothetical protein
MTSLLQPQDPDPRISLNIQRFTDSECDPGLDASKAFFSPGPGEKKVLDALAGAIIRISIKRPERKNFGQECIYKGLSAFYRQIPDKQLTYKGFFQT